MVKIILILFWFEVALYSVQRSAYGINLIEPQIQCTVVKVISTVNIFGIKKFPALHQSINNDPIESTLHIGRVRLAKVQPFTMFKSKLVEIISIRDGNQQLDLELNGKPMSRQGVIKYNGAVLAELTCH